MAGILQIGAIGAAALYVLAAALSIRYLWSGDRTTLERAAGVMTAGGALYVLVFAVRWAATGRVPFTSVFDSLGLFVILSTGIILAVLRAEGMRALLCFHLPPLAAIAVTAAAVAGRHLPEAPRELRGSFLLVHVGVALLSFALFFVASMTSAAYLFQAHNLKQRRTQGLFGRLSSLEKLDATLYGLIRAGYPLFLLTLFLGLVWARIDRELLGPYWFASPKVLLSLAMAAFYAVTFHTRRFGLLRGPKLAALVLCGFAGLLGLYLVLGLMRINHHFFWGPLS